jgi:serine 3-dehydrogenase (NADP+)
VTLKNQAVLVVGASSGIGREVARAFAREEARVIAAARRRERLENLKQELAAESKTIDVIEADASKLEDMQRLAEHTFHKLGGVDILVFAAGTNTPDRAMTRLNPAIWDSLLQVNLNGAYYITYAVLPRMRDVKSGHLIYVASISGLLADVSGAAYQASKRGLVALAHAIRMEEKENGIRTSAVCPGLVDTELIDKRPVKPSAETMSKALRPEDVAGLIVAIAKLPPHATVPEIQILPTYL